MSVKSSPTPLFDTIEHLSTLRKQAKYNRSEIANNRIEEDYHYAIEFIYSYRGSEATFNAYRREIERLLHWSWLIAQKSVKDLRRHDIEDFIEFCQKPPITWIGTKNVARFIEQSGSRIINPNWRPFVATVSKIAHRKGETPSPKNYSLSQKAVQAIFAILSSFFNYLIQEDYAAINPVTQMRQKSKFIRKQQTQSVIRRLSELQWAYVIETAELLASQQPEIHERTLFIMNALYGMYLRISELASSARWQPQMGHFYKDSDDNWWFITVGKGNKERLITVSDAMLQALKRYRRSFGLSLLPTTGETTALIINTKTRKPLTSTRQIRSIVQICFNEAIERLIRDGFLEDAEQLKAATVHWLRHTGISDDVKHRPREHVRDDAGHGSSAITDKYIDIELRARHASGRRKIIKPE
ncbi:MAG: wecD [Gammaproteobacteria bacterium]|jgi:site-specific recombinase XerD|nr:wecD [Gammaproteobacteria bacterium]